MTRRPTRPSVATSSIRVSVVVITAIAALAYGFSTVAVPDPAKAPRSAAAQGGATPGAQTSVEPRDTYVLSTSCAADILSDECGARVPELSWANIIKMCSADPGYANDAACSALRPALPDCQAQGIACFENVGRDQLVTAIGNFCSEDPAAPGCSSLQRGGADCTNDPACSTNVTSNACAEGGGGICPSLEDRFTEFGRNAPQVDRQSNRTDPDDPLVVRGELSPRPAGDITILYTKLVDNTSDAGDLNLDRSLRAVVFTAGDVPDAALAVDVPPWLTPSDVAQSFPGPVPSSESAPPPSLPQAGDQVPFLTTLWIQTANSLSAGGINNVDFDNELQLRTRSFNLETLQWDDAGPVTDADGNALQPRNANLSGSAPFPTFYVDSNNNIFIKNAGTSMGMGARGIDAEIVSLGDPTNPVTVSGFTRDVGTSQDATPQGGGDTIPFIRDVGLSGQTYSPGSPGDATTGGGFQPFVAGENPSLARTPPDIANALGNLFDPINDPEPFIAVPDGRDAAVQLMIVVEIRLSAPGRDFVPAPPPPEVPTLWSAIQRVFPFRGINAAAAPTNPLSGSSMSPLRAAPLPASGAATAGSTPWAQSPVQMFLTNIGSSTGEAFTAHVFNNGDQPMDIDIKGLVVEPLKEEAQRIVQEQLQQILPENPVTASLDAYCLEFLRLPPLPNQMFQLAPKSLQEQFAPIRKVLDAAKQLNQLGLLPPDSDPAAYFHSITQWAVWAKQEGLDESSFTDAFVDYTRKRVEAAGNQWTNQFDDVLRDAAAPRWQNITRILEAAEGR